MGVHLESLAIRAKWWFTRFIIRVLGHYFFFRTQLIQILHLFCRLVKFSHCKVDKEEAATQIS